MSSDVRSQQLTTAALLVWLAALVVLLVRWVVKNETPRWFEIVFFVTMIGMVYTSRGMVDPTEGPRATRTFRYLALIAGVLMLAGQAVNLLAQ